jgi:tetratricopeptide (TPR) repeat protein
VILALVAGIVGTTWQAVRTEKARQAEAERAEGERRAKERAEANFALANEAVQKYLGTVTNDPELQRADFYRLRKKLLESALPFFQKIAAQKSDDPQVEAGRGQAYQRLADVHWSLGENEAAKEDAEAMRAIFVRLTADFPAVAAYRHYLSGGYHYLALSLESLEKPVEAEAAYRQAVDIEEKLAADFPTVPEYRQALGQMHDCLGTLLARQKKLLEAETALRQGLDIQRKLAADFGTVPVHRYLLASSHNSLGNVLSELGKRGEADAAYREALAIQEMLTADFPNESDYATLLGAGYCNFGILTRESGQLETALGWFQKAIARLGPVVNKEPRLVQAREFLRNSHQIRARTLDDLGRHSDAVRDWERALELDDGGRKDYLRANLAGSRLRQSQKDKDGAGCLAAAAEYEALKRTDAGELYDSACHRAICAAVIREDPKTPHADAPRLAKEQADLAMGWLHRAVAAGYKDAAHMKKDEDLDALREREDFKKLLAELQAKKK